MNIKVVQIHDGCDKYEKRHKQQRTTQMLKYTLNDLLTEISEVRKVLEAEKDEFNE